MQGRADVLAAVGRRSEAADTLDRLAANLERDGRLADACDVARRALELAESRGRRRSVETLVARLRTAAPGDTAAAEALERALGVLEFGARSRSLARPGRRSRDERRDGRAAPWRRPRRRPIPRC